MEINYTKEHYATKEEWLKNRSFGFGGTSASAILNLSPWVSKLDLYGNVVCKIENETQENEAMTYGTQAEDLIRKLFDLDFNNRYEVIAPNGIEMFRRKDKPFLTSTPDGHLIEKATGRKGILEIKTHDIRNKEDESFWEGQIPQNYFAQVLHYLMVLNDYDFVILCAKLRYFNYFAESGKEIKESKIKYYYIDRKELADQIEKLEQKETEFYQENIVKKIVPQMVFNF